MKIIRAIMEDTIMGQEKYTAKTLAALQSAQQIAAMKYHQEITSAHVLLALAKEPEGLLATIFEECQTDMPMLKARLEQELAKIPSVKGTDRLGMGMDMVRVLGRAEEYAKSMKDDYVSTEHLLLALATDGSSEVQDICRQFHLTKSAIQASIRKNRKQNVTTDNPEEGYKSLEKFGRDLTAAARAGKRVLLIEKMDKSGRKVRITGKGRCNVTNARPAEEFAAQVRTNAEFLGQAFAEFNNRAAIRFFEKAGVKLDIERGERVFPKSGKAWDIANALLEFCVENGVKIIYNTRVTEILTLGDRVFGVKYINRRGFERKEECAQVILATGGVSYPATGSTGDGYAFAADLGHTIEPLRPSLTPLLSSHAQMRYLDKVLLRNVRATLYVDNEPVREEFGEIGFSDRGIEGAVALRMSRDAVDALIEEKRVKLVLDLKPALTEEVLHERIAREIAELQPNEFFGELLRKLVPKPLVMPLAQEVDIRANCYVGKITEEQITRLVRTLKGLTFPITDYAPFEYAIVTAGGVSCAEVNPYTMESLKIRGLYFAGEVLDLDANTGGYNLQIAFSTGRLAGSLKK